MDFRTTPEQVLTDKLWFSDQTKFKTSIVKDWNRNGLRFIADLYCKKSGSLLDKNALSETFNIKMYFLCYGSLIKSIPHHTDNLMVRSIIYPIIPYKIALLARKVNTSRLAYIRNLPWLCVNSKHTSRLKIISNVNGLETWDACMKVRCMISDRLQVIHSYKLFIIG